MLKSKKGIGLMWYGLILAILVWIVAYFVGVLSQQKTIDNYIGQYQFAIMKADNEAEKALLFVEQSARIVAQQAAYDFSLKGGYYAPTDCGTFKDANVWATIDKSTNEVKECYPGREIDKNFVETFGENFGRYLINYPDAEIPAGAYSYKLDGSYLIGSSYAKIRFEIEPKTFVVKPKIKIPAKVSTTPVPTIISTEPTEIYQKALAADIPKQLNEPQGPTPNVEVVKKYHPEVWVQYTELCKRMNALTLSGEPPGACKSPKVKCCISSAYRSPKYNKKVGGADNSPHPTGTALDIYVSRDVNEQLRWVKFAVDEAKLFTRGAIYPGSDHIHVDLMPLKGPYTARYWIGRGGQSLIFANSISQLETEARKNKYIT